MSTFDDERDALGDFNRKARDKDVRKIMIIVIPIFSVFVFIMATFTSNETKQQDQDAQFQLRDTWDCTHIQQDMVYRGWNTPKQDTSDIYFNYDMKLHNQMGCKP